MAAPDHLIADLEAALAQTDGSPRRRAELETWRPVDLAAVRIGDDPPRGALFRRDAVPLLYGGMWNSIYGSPEATKTWLSQVAGGDRIKAAERHSPGGTRTVVVVIDFEDVAAVWLRRLELLGVPQEVAARRLVYVNLPAELPDADALPDAVIAGLIDAELVVVDSVNAAMGMAGLDPISNADTLRWRSTFVDQLLEVVRRSDEPAAILGIDHAAAADTADRLNPIGAVAKFAGVRGVQLKADVITQPAPGQAGRVALYVTKDPNGLVRAASRLQGDRRHFVGTFILEPDGDPRLTNRVRGVILEPQTVDDMPDNLRRAILDAAAKAGDKGASKRTLLELMRAAGAKGKSTTLRDAIDILAGQGQLEARPVGANVRYFPVDHPSEGVSHGRDAPPPGTASRSQDALEPRLPVTPTAATVSVRRDAPGRTTTRLVRPASLPI